MYITTLGERYVKMYENFISQLKMSASVMSPFEGLSTNLSSDSNEIKGNLNEVKKAIQITNPDNDIVIKRSHLYYDMI